MSLDTQRRSSNDRKISKAPLDEEDFSRSWQKKKKNDSFCSAELFLVVDLSRAANYRIVYFVDRPIHWPQATKRWIDPTREHLSAE